MYNLPNVKVLPWKTVIRKAQNVKLCYWIIVLIFMLASKIFHSLIPIDVYPNTETDEKNKF